MVLDHWWQVQEAGDLTRVDTWEVEAQGSSMKVNSIICLLFKISANLMVLPLGTHAPHLQILAESMLCGPSAGPIMISKALLTLVSPSKPPRPVGGLAIAT